MKPDAFGGDYKFYFYTASAYEGPSAARRSPACRRAHTSVNATVKMSNTDGSIASRMELSGYDGDASRHMVDIPLQRRVSAVFLHRNGSDGRPS